MDFCEYTGSTLNLAAIFTEILAVTLLLVSVNGLLTS